MISWGFFIIFVETIRDMEDLFATYNQALALKELGFNEPCFGNYNNLTDKTRFIFGKTNEGTITWNKVPGTNKIVISNDRILAPLKQQVFKWFRDNYKIQSLVQEYLLNNYMYTIDDGISSDISIVGFETYEEAESACIDNLIEIIKEKK